MTSAIRSAVVYAARRISRPSTSKIQDRSFCDLAQLSQLEYEKQSEQTLSKLADYMDTLPDVAACDPSFDVSYSMGVLTAKIGQNVGTYVINKQTPNRQIWLSSPISGPKRYDFHQTGKWIYLHDGVSLHELLEKEFREIYQTDRIIFTNLV
ncbi:frataxin-like domain-containing protein [Ditylenchus destructor]|nr:frataxin-like domain-containing protein [Ditylenchus destructor]